ncbi:MAG TPA: hypothetical protein PLB25_04230 [Rhodoferax sp.]|nr:hypothetical protein [Rhodoferax sp.]
MRHKPDKLPARFWVAAFAGMIELHGNKLFLAGRNVTCIAPNGLFRPNNTCPALLVGAPILFGIAGVAAGLYQSA